MMIGRRSLFKVALVCILIAPIYRLAVFELGPNSRLNWLLPGAMDFLAAGALLGYAEHEQIWQRVRCVISSDWVTLPSILAAFALIPLGPHSIVLMLFSPIAIIVASVSLITASVGRQGPHLLLDCLNWPVVRRVGRISYGIYVYHPFIRFAFEKYYPLSALMPAHGGRVLTFLIYVGVTLIMAELSFRFVEAPLLKLKRKPLTLPHPKRQVELA